MPDARKHRGAHPSDAQLFAPRHLASLRAAVADLSWLLSRDYAVNSALKLVGDRYDLRERQRLAVVRAAASDQQVQHRQNTLLPLSEVRGQRLVIDGFNLIITLEAALSGGVIIAGRDGCLRDLSSVHGSYRSVTETETAIQLISAALMPYQPAAAWWLLDQPVSNSGWLASRIRDLAAAHHWPWEVEVVLNPDRTICESGWIALTSDSNVLDGVQHWINLTQAILDQSMPAAWVIDLR
ncbi:MAG TPA: DUF434 domain-containing protein [Blastocatellia bacterium]|nr:DUF434 domain-containing protein [Blastocatellia bacterium]